MCSLLDGLWCVIYAMKVVKDVGQQILAGTVAGANMF